MLQAFRAFEAELIRRLQGRGIHDVTYANLNVIRHLDPEGLRLSALAHDACMSKQALGKVVSELAQKGYVALEADPLDGRAKRVQYTKKGQALLKVAVTIVAEMENAYRDGLGSRGYGMLRKSLVLAKDLFPL